jgi:saccharopine dehydrogenase (NAD+, L-lysine-forming)
MSKKSVKAGVNRGKVVIIGAGGVGGVVAHKVAQAAEHFPEVILASRTLSKCQAIAKQLPRAIRTAAIDADNVPALTKFLKKEKPFLVINVALPYQDLPIMDACLAAGVHYLDTANYEPPNIAKFEYKWQWAYQEKFQKAGLMALLGSGFDPGVTNVFCAYAQKKLFDRIEQIDILDSNAGDHGLPFAPNFHPEINLRAVSARGRDDDDFGVGSTGQIDEGLHDAGALRRTPALDHQSALCRAVFGSLRGEAQSNQKRGKREADRAHILKW